MEWRREKLVRKLRNDERAMGGWRMGNEMWLAAKDM